MVRMLVYYFGSGFIIVWEPTTHINSSKLKGKCAMQHFLHKSKSSFRFWTFFLSIFEKGKYFCVKTYAEFHL